MVKRAPRWLTVGTVAAVFAVSWRHELFLIVIAMPAAAITLMVHARLTDRSHGRRAAALALVAPTGVADPTELERIIAADLAAASLGDPEMIDSALALAEHSINDPGRRTLACERLQAARHMLEGTPFAGKATGAAWRRPVVRAIGASAVICALAALATTGHRGFLIPLACGVTALCLAVTEARRAERLRALLVRRATTDPAKRRLVVPDDAVIAAVRSLASTNPRVRATASSIIDAWPGPERSVARRRLAVEPEPRIRLSRLDRNLAACGLVAAALIALLEAL